MRYSRLILVLVVFMVAAVIALRNQSAILAARTRVGQSEARLAALQSESEALARQMEETQKRIAAESAAKVGAVAAVAAESRRLAEIDPETLWTEPPSNLPDWGEESPYVWLSKDILPRLPLVPFTDAGEISPSAARVLALSEEQRRQLNARLRSALEQYRAIESASAEVTTNHLPGIRSVPGDRLTIVVRPMREEGERLKQEYTSAIREHLGAQRSELLLRVGGNWLDAQFSQEAGQARTISAVRHGNGTYSVSILTAASSMSVGGLRELDEYIPPHLQTYFDPLRDSGTGKP